MKFITKFLLVAFATALAYFCPTPLKTQAQCDDLMIVEYMDASGGSGWAIKIYNPTSSPIALSGYSVTVDYTNGITGGNDCAALPAVNLGPLDSYIINNALFTPSGSTCPADFQTGLIGVNGNDAISLVKGPCGAGTIVDMIGSTGFGSCGSAWCANAQSVTIDGVQDALFESKIIRKPFNTQRYTLNNGANFNQQNGFSAAGWSVGDPALGDNHTGWKVMPTACLTSGIGGSGQYAGLFGLDLSTPITVTVGQTINLSAPGYCTYSWTGPAAFNSTSKNPSIPNATLGNNGFYTVTMYCGGCVASDDQEVIVLSSPFIDAWSDTTICAGETVQLNSTPGFTAYSWTPSATLNNSSIANPVATPNSTTSYTVTATDVNGVTGTASVTVTVVPRPTMPVISGPTDTLCKGDDASMPLNWSLPFPNDSTAYWESSKVPGVFQVVPGSRGQASILPTNLQERTCFNATIKTELCPPVRSNFICIEVDTNCGVLNCASAAGTLAGSATHCSSTNSGRLELVGYTGTITGWEVSFDNFATSFPFNYTLDYLNYANVSQPLWFRAKVSNGPNCDTVSNIAVIDPTGTPPQAGVVVGPTTICQGSAAPVTLSLNGHIGNIVRWESSTNGFSTSTPIANTNNFYVVNNLSQATAYRAVINNGGCDGYSATHTVTPVNCCPQAQNVQIGSITHNSFEVSWTNAASPNLFGFSVFYRAVGAPVWQSQFTSGSPVSITGLSNGTAYEVYVESACTQGSATSPIVTDTTLTQPPCTAPTNLNVAMVTLTSVMLDWNAVPTAMFYEISYRRDDQPGNWQSAFSGTNSTTLSGLAPTTWYRVRVRSFCGGQISPYSMEIFFQTAPQTTGCGVPTNLSATTPNSMTGVINWNAVPGASRYVLQHRVAGSSVWTTDTVYSSPFTIGGLTPTTTYDYRVQSICGPNSSAFSAPANFMTPMQMCSAPTTVSSVTSTSSSATLTWPPSPDAFLYAVQYRPVGAANWSFTSTVTTSVSMFGLTPGVQYEVRIRTYCQTLGVSSLSNSIFFTTNAGIREGAAEAAKSSNLSVYPNPNNGAFTVAFESEDSGTAYLSLYDARGAKVWRESRDLSIGANTLRVDAELPGGLYLLELRTSEGKQVVKLVVE